MRSNSRSLLRSPRSRRVSFACILSTNLVLISRLVPPKAKGTRGKREVIKPLSGLNIEALLLKNKPKKISRENAVPDFKQMLVAPETDEAVAAAVDGMAEIVRELLLATGDVKQDQAQENIKVMREAMIDFEFPDLYNDFIKDLKKRIFNKEFGNRREFWQNIKHAKLGLIDTDILPVSDVSPEEATEVCNGIRLRNDTLIYFSSSMLYPLDCPLAIGIIRFATKQDMVVFS